MLGGQSFLVCVADKSTDVVVITTGFFIFLYNTLIQSRTLQTLVLLRCKFERHPLALVDGLHEDRLRHCARNTSTLGRGTYHTHEKVLPRGDVVAMVHIKGRRKGQLLLP